MSVKIWKQEQSESLTKICFIYFFIYLYLIIIIKKFYIDKKKKKKAKTLRVEGRKVGKRDKKIIIK